MTNEEAKKILSGYVKACNEDDFLTLEMFEYEKVIEAMTMGAKALSMPELPSNLDEAAQKVEDYYDVGEEHGYLCCHRGDIKNAFKAGAEWHNSKTQKLSSDIDEAAEEYFEQYNYMPKGFVVEAFKAGAEWHISKMPKLPDNLDEAAEEYGRKEYSHAIHFWDEGLSKNKPEVMKEDFVDSFKAGAEWMAGQEVIVMQGTVDEACYSNLSELLDRDDLSADDEIELFFRKK